MPKKIETAATISAVTVTVLGESARFYRGGHGWTKTPQTVPVSSFTDAQLKLIRGESMLNVIDVTMPAPTMGGEAADMDGSE